MIGERYIALLRGINVGGNNKLPMKDLLEMFAAAKCRQARSFIQSGNIIFDATPAIAAAVPKIISAQIGKKFGYRVPVITRSLREFKKVVSANPFIRRGVSPDTLHLMFLADAPSADAIAALDSNRSPHDEFAVRGREVYLNLPNGVARTKLSNAYFDSKLATVGTQRNWRTVAALLEMMKE